MRGPLAGTLTPDTYAGGPLPGGRANHGPPVRAGGLKGPSANQQGRTTGE